ncbi:uncharacterized protein [Apostichopus japonicus]|uniref:uncharacterized protein n=1 Tax=Stichopus japonicus TaxID=307972 RepID=UPI003AB255A9
MEYEQFFIYGANNGYTIFTWILILVALLCNIPVFTSITDASFRLKSRNKYVISMSAANVMLLIDVAVIPLFGVPSPIPAQAVTVSITEMYEFITEVLIVIVLLDQYRVVSQPTVINAETDNTRMKRRLCTVWSSSILMMIAVSLLQVFLTISGYAVLIAVFFLLPYILALIVSVLLIINIVRTMKQQDADNQGEAAVTRSENIRQVTRALIAIVVLFFILLLPSKVYIWFMYNAEEDTSSLTAFNLIVVVGYILAAVSAPVVLMIASTEYRTVFLRCCCCLYGRQPRMIKIPDSPRNGRGQDGAKNGVEGDRLKDYEEVEMEA